MAGRDPGYQAVRACSPALPERRAFDSGVNELATEGFGATLDRPTGSTDTAPTGATPVVGFTRGGDCV